MQTQTYINNDQIIKFNISPDHNSIIIILEDVGMGDEYILAKLIGGKYEWVSEKNKNLYFSLFRKYIYLKRHLKKAIKLLDNSNTDNDLKIRMQCFKRKFSIQVSKILK
jgi:hypothetical protein